MAIKFGLKARFVAACLLLVSITTLASYFAVSQMIEFLEVEMVQADIDSEMRVFAEGYRRDPDHLGPRSKGLKSYVLRSSEISTNTVPESLRNLPFGIHDDLHLDGREVAVGRVEVNGSSLFVVRDLEAIEKMEDEFLFIAWLCAALSWFAAVMLALWLAKRVLQPVTELALAVGKIDPSDLNEQLAPHFGNHEVRQIAVAFDLFVDRLQNFVEREQTFTEDASHELRTPLTVIDGAAQLLSSDESLSPIARDRVDRISRASKQMNTLIESLLFLARDDKHNSAQILEMDTLIREVTEHHRPTAQAKGLSISLQLQPHKISAPKGMALSVVGNLLVNAIHNTRSGGIDVLLAEHRLSVRDSGLGIAPENLSLIFERRYRGPDSRGLGLGLYLVKRICDRLGWRIQVHSQPGQGTTFEVCFPE